MASMLALMQQTMTEMGLPSPLTAAGNTNQDVTQTLSLLNAVGYELQRQHQWQALTKEYRFTTVFYNYTATVTSGSQNLSVLSSTTGLTSTPTYFMVTGAGINQDTYLSSVSAGPATAVLSQAASASGTAVALAFNQTKYAMPSDYDRLIDDTDWDKSRHWRMMGPETAQQWQWLKSGFISSGPRVRFRVLGGLFQIWPALGAADYMGFEYVSNLWVTATATLTGPDKTSFTVDTDTCIFPDRLMVLGTKLKYFQIKGFDTTAIFQDYRVQLDLAKAHDAGSPSLSMAPRPSSSLIGWDNIPDSGFGA